MYEQEAPFAVQLEATEGCPLRCSFCGLNGIRGKDNDYKFMTVDTINAIARSIAEAGWNVRLEFAMHGEPTMHPDLPMLVTALRQHLPKAPILVTTNGAGLQNTTADKILHLFDAGVTTLAVDEYQGVSWAKRIREAMLVPPGADYKKAFFNGIDFHEYPASPGGNPHQRTNRRRLVIIAPIDLASEGTHSLLNNHAGAGAAPNNSAEGKRCAKPFRELSFRWDGSVAVCCNDWRGQLPIGNIHTHTLEQIWQSPRLQAVRRLLYHGRRTVPPCLGCDALSYRVGLLPDKKGKVAMPEPTDDDLRVLAEALAEGPLTAPVLREWEK